MSFFSTFSSASIRGFFGSSEQPIQYQLLNTYTRSGNSITKYRHAYVSRKDIGNGQFITATTGLGNCEIKNIANTLNKTITGVGGQYFQSLINEQGNLVITAGVPVRIWEYQSNNYVNIGNIARPANFNISTGLSISSNANVLLVSWGGGTNLGIIQVYDRSGNSFTLRETINTPNSNCGRFGFSTSISDNGNIFVTSAMQSSNSFANLNQIFTYEYNGSNFVLQNVINQNTTYFGDTVSINSSGNIIMASGGYGQYIYTYNFDGTNWVSDQIIPRGVGLGPNSITQSAFSANTNSIILVTGDPSENSNAGQGYYYIGQSFFKSNTLPWANTYANSRYGFNVAADNDCNIVAVTNSYLNSNLSISNTHVINIFEKL